MNIIFCTNIHGSFAEVYTLMRETVADVYILSGRLIDRAFYSRELDRQLDSLRNEVIKTGSIKNMDDKSPVTLAEHISKGTGFTDQQRETASKFITLHTRATHSITRKYEMFDGVLSTKPHVTAFILPGEKGELAGTSLEKRNIHNIVHALNKFDILGYTISPSLDKPDHVIKELSVKKKKGSPDSQTNMAVFSLPHDYTVDTADTKHPVPGIIMNFCNETDADICLFNYPGYGFTVYMNEGTLYVAPPHFGGHPRSDGSYVEGGYFYDLEFDQEIIKRIILRKLVRDRVYDLSEYLPSGNSLHETVIDQHRHECMKNNVQCDTLTERHTPVPEIRRFKDIRNFFRMYQTEETDRKVTKLARSLESLSDEIPDAAIDIVGSVNLGLAQESSDVDLVLYICSDEEACYDEDQLCDRFDEVGKEIRTTLRGDVDIEVIDNINLNRVMDSIRKDDVECPALQRFVVYRSICRPVNYRVIAPVEDMLNENIKLRIEIEKIMAEYLQVIGTTKDTTRSFSKYQSRIRSLGVDIPEVLQKKIVQFTRNQ
ncbi:MAG: nucleotidyltransferase domain-containing protein [Spirochaetota bacterium]